MKLPFGKHRGEDLEDVPGGYLRWLAQPERDLHEPLRSAVRHEVHRRGAEKLAGDPEPDARDAAPNPSVAEPQPQGDDGAEQAEAEDGPAPDRSRELVGGVSDHAQTSAAGESLPEPPLVLSPEGVAALREVAKALRGAAENVAHTMRVAATALDRALESARPADPFAPPHWTEGVEPACPEAAADFEGTL